MATTVSYAATYTRNLGNYESAKITYGLSTDEFLDGESEQDVRLRLKETVGGWVAEDVNEIDEDNRSRR